MNSIYNTCFMNCNEIKTNIIKLCLFCKLPGGPWIKEKLEIRAF